MTLYISDETITTDYGTVVARIIQGDVVKVGDVIVGYRPRQVSVWRGINPSVRVTGIRLGTDGLRLARVAQSGQSGLDALARAITPPIEWRLTGDWIVALVTLPPGWLTKAIRVSPTLPTPSPSNKARPIQTFAVAPALKAWGGVDPVPAICEAASRKMQATDTMTGDACSVARLNDVEKAAWSSRLAALVKESEAKAKEADRNQVLIQLDVD